MPTKKNKPKYEPIYTFDAQIPLKKLLKGSLLINFAPILIIFIFVFNGGLKISLAIGLVLAIFLLSLLFIYPYLADLQELTKYVKTLTSKNEAKKPSLSFLNNVEELSEQIDNLNSSWETKNNKLKKNLENEKKTQRMLQDFVSNASHEMKTPLASIKGFTETILDMEKKSGDEEKFLNIILDQSVRLEKLISELLVLSRLEENRESEKDKIDFSEIVDNCLKNLSAQIKDRKAKIKTDISKNLPKYNASKVDISRALENLVSNAVRYNNDGVNIGISVERINKLPKDVKTKTKAERYIKMSVSDNGIGIEEEEIPRITERFYRIDKARSRKAGGSGLGLAIVKQIVENNNGGMEINSQVGAGSTFSIYLPV